MFIKLLFFLFKKFQYFGIILRNVASFSYKQIVVSTNFRIRHSPQRYYFFLIYENKFAAIWEFGVFLFGKMAENHLGQLLPCAEKAVPL